MSTELPATVAHTLELVYSTGGKNRKTFVQMHGTAELTRQLIVPAGEKDRELALPLPLDGMVGLCLVASTRLIVTPDKGDPIELSPAEPIYWAKQLAVACPLAGDVGRVKIAVPEPDAQPATLDVLAIWDERPAADKPVAKKRTAKKPAAAK